MEKVDRIEAKQRGLRRYFSGEPCSQGHIAPRLVRNRECAQCRKEYLKLWRARQRGETVPVPEYTTTKALEQPFDSIRIRRLALELKSRHSFFELEMMVLAASARADSNGYFWMTENEAAAEDAISLIAIESEGLFQ